MAGGANHSRLTGIIYPNGYTVSYNYASGLDDTLSRLTSLSDNTGTLESYKYLGLSTVVERDHPQPGVNLTYVQQTGDPNANTDGGDPYTGLDRFGRVIDQYWINAASGTATDRFQYGYDRDSNVLFKANLVDAAFSELYHANGPGNGYDPLNQLTAFARGALSDTNADGIPDTVASPSHSQSWATDAVGNFTSVTTDGTQVSRTHNKQNELTAVGGVNLGYDANGNTTTDDQGHTLVYDAWNRLVAVKNGSTTLAAYQYDAKGNRIVVTESGTTTDLYFSDQGQVLEERIGGQAKAHYVWSPVYVNALVLRDRDATGGGSLNERLWVQQDANWNVTALVNTSAAVVERYACLPFGQVTYLSPAWVVLTNSAYVWLFLHQGGRFDPNTGLYRFGRRDYSPGQGRWEEPDPIGFRGGDTNLYRADANNPVRYTDPSGEFVFLVAAGVVLAIAGIAALHYAAYRYDHAREEYLSKPIDQWTPEVQAEYRDYVKTTEWIAAAGKVAAVTGIFMVATPFLSFGAGWLWGAGLWGKVIVGGATVWGIGSAGYEGYSIVRDWNQMSGPQRFERIGLLVGPMVVGALAGPRYFRMGFVKARPTYNLGGVGEVRGAINVQPPGAELPPQPRVITPSNRLPFAPGSGNIVVNNSPISPQAGGTTGPYGPLGPPYMPQDIAAIASGGHRISITQGVGRPGVLTSGQQAVVDAVPAGSQISVAGGQYSTTVTIITPLPLGGRIASYSPSALGGLNGLASRVISDRP